MDDDKAPETKEQAENQANQPATKTDTDTPPKTTGINRERDPEPDPDPGFDFGGLPARNLKKNLGCG